MYFLFRIRLINFGYSSVYSRIYVLHRRLVLPASSRNFHERHSISRYINCARRSNARVSINFFCLSFFREHVQGPVHRDRRFIFTSIVRGTFAVIAFEASRHGHLVVFSREDRREERDCSQTWNASHEKFAPPLSIVLRSSLYSTYI